MLQPINQTTTLNSEYLHSRALSINFTLLISIFTNRPTPDFCLYKLEKVHSSFLECSSPPHESQFAYNLFRPAGTWVYFRFRSKVGEGPEVNLSVFQSSVSGETISVPQANKGSWPQMGVEWLLLLAKKSQQNLRFQCPQDLPLCPRSNFQGLISSHLCPHVNSRHLVRWGLGFMLQFFHSQNEIWVQSSGSQSCSCRS